MHESAIAHSILEIVSKRLSQTARTKSVRGVHVVVGEFRNVDPESLEFAFDNLRDLHDGCHDCKLTVEVTKSLALCKNNGHIYHPSYNSVFACDKCGSGIGKLLCGEELDVVKIVLEAEDDGADKRSHV